MRLLIIIVALVLCACARTTPPVSGRVPMAVSAAVTKSYAATNARITNPERGFYHHSGNCDKDLFVVADMKRYRTDGNISLVMCIFYLREFRNSSISQTQLERFDAQAAAVRQAGLKMVVRFAYSEDEKDKPFDVPLWRVKAHIAQLAPHLQDNSDVIAVVQSGFVGAWGEGYYSSYFGNNGVVSQTDWANRKAVVAELLRVLPESRSVQVRTPTMKRRMYGTAPVTSDLAFGGSAVSRVGHHNDSFLSDETDEGTYDDVSVEVPYLQADSRYTPVGGETPLLNPPRSGCSNAPGELKQFHYTYLNIDFESDVLDSWRNGGCMPQIERQLGYRLALVSTEFPASVRRGSTFAGRIVIRNGGWAGLVNPRRVELVLRETSTRKTVRLAISADPRRWSAGSDATVAQNFKLPSTIPLGTYELLLSLPDSSPSLKSRPEYAVQLANVGVWEASTGLNHLLRTLKVY